MSYAVVMIIHIISEVYCSAVKFEHIFSEKSLNTYVYLGQVVSVTFQQNYISFCKKKKKIILFL